MPAPNSRAGEQAKARQEGPGGTRHLHILLTASTVYSILKKQRGPLPFQKFFHMLGPKMSQTHTKEALKGFL